jgi:hypothetical protein
LVPANKQLQQRVCPHYVIQPAQILNFSPLDFSPCSANVPICVEFNQYYLYLSVAFDPNRSDRDWFTKLETSDFIFWVCMIIELKLLLWFISEHVSLVVKAWNSMIGITGLLIYFKILFILIKGWFIVVFTHVQLREWLFTSRQQPSLIDIPQGYKPR